MDLYFGLAVLVMLVGLVVLLVQRRWNEVWSAMFLAGLIACLLRFAGHASLHIGS